MNDLISRQAAIDATAEYLRDMAKIDNPSLPMSIDGWKPLVEKIFDKVPSAQPEQRWIPCRERLPKAFEYCLWTTTDGKVVYHYCDGQFSKYIAWMPLPEPYAERRIDD